MHPSFSYHMFLLIISCMVNIELPSDHGLVCCTPALPVPEPPECLTWPVSREATVEVSVESFDRLMFMFNYNVGTVKEKEVLDGHAQAHIERVLGKSSSIIPPEGPVQRSSLTDDERPVHRLSLAALQRPVQSSPVVPEQPGQSATAAKGIVH